MQRLVATSWLPNHALALCALAWAAAGRVQANCGHYVVSAVDIERQVEPHVILPGHDAAPSFAVVLERIRAGTGKAFASMPCTDCAPRPALPLRLPCRGPSCSGDDRPLVPSSSTRVPPPREQQAVWEPTACDLGPARRCRCVSREAIHPIRHVVPIYHPPRCT